LIELVFVWKDGCGICELMQPSFRKILSDHPEWKGRVAYYKEPDIFRTIIQNDVSMAPAILIFKDGAYMGSWQGSFRKESLVAFVRSLV